jgi:ankyrin repeat protein
MKSGKTHQKPLHLAAHVKRGDYAAIKRNRRMINAGNRATLLELAVRDFTSAPKKPSHVELVKFLIQMGAKPDFQLVCAATVGPHVDIMNALIEAGAEQNIFTAAALGDVDMVRRLLSKDSALASRTTDHDLLLERHATALHYACISELGKVNQAYADQLFRCVALLLDKRLTRVTELAGSDNSLDLCASRGGNVKIAQLLMEHGWRPTISTVLGALGHGFRHGKGNYEVASLCLEAGVDVNQFVGARSLLHAFAHQGDIVGTRWLVDKGAKINLRDCGNDTPLHKACERNSTLRVVELLVEHGASLTATNNNGQTPLDMAIQNDKKSIAAYLRRVGAKSGAERPRSQHSWKRKRRQTNDSP